MQPPKDMKEEAIKQAVKEFYTNGETDQLVLRTGEALPLKEPQKITIKGSIESPRIYFNARKNSHNIAPETATVIHNDKSITLTVNDKNHYCDTIVGELKPNPDLALFNINTDTTFSHEGIRKEFRPLRRFFEDMAQYDSIMLLLNDFKAKIQSNYENAKNNATGDFKAVFERTVDAAPIPKFNLKMPLFVGTEKKVIPVQIEYDPVGTSIGFKLVSLELYDLIDAATEELLNKELEVFKTEGIAVIRSI